MEGEAALEKLLLQLVPADAVWPEARRPSSSYELARGPVLWAGATAIVPVANTVPWGYLVEHRKVGGGLGRGHSAETTRPWRPIPTWVWVRLPASARPWALRVRP